VTPVHSWKGTFKGQPALFKFTSVTGHVYNIDFTQEFNSWEIDPLRLFSAPTKKMEANPKMHLCRHLQSESKGADYLVLWLDCDREGENICFEVMENCVPKMKQPTNQGKMSHVYRAKFSGIFAHRMKLSCKTAIHIVLHCSYHRH
jgi:DNA topoisomerase-3